jgi:hypothetical protein
MRIQWCHAAYLFNLYNAITLIKAMPICHQNYRTLIKQGIRFWSCCQKEIELPKNGVICPSMDVLTPFLRHFHVFDVASSLLNLSIEPWQQHVNNWSNQLSYKYVHRNNTMTPFLLKDIV